MISVLVCAFLAADPRILTERLRGLVLIGELALDGWLCPMRGVLWKWPPQAVIICC